MFCTAATAISYGKIEPKFKITQYSKISKEKGENWQ
jgi:hypothetical protein